MTTLNYYHTTTLMGMTARMSSSMMMTPWGLG